MVDASWGLLGPILLQFFHKSATKTPNFILILWDRCPYFHSLGEDEEKKSWFIIKIISIFTFLSVSLYLFFLFLLSFAFSNIQYTYYYYYLLINFVINLFPLLFAESNHQQWIRTTRTMPGWVAGLILISWIICSWLLDFRYLLYCFNVNLFGTFVELVSDRGPKWVVFFTNTNLDMHKHILNIFIYSFN